MLFDILEVIVLCFAIIGVIASINRITLRVLHPKGREKYCVVYPLDNTSDAHTLYSARLRLNLTIGADNAAVIGLDCGANDDWRDVFIALCRECEGIYFIQPAELSNFIIKYCNGS